MIFLKNIRLFRASGKGIFSLPACLCREGGKKPGKEREKEEQRIGAAEKTDDADLSEQPKQTLLTGAWQPCSARSGGARKPQWRNRRSKGSDREPNRFRP